MAETVEVVLTLKADASNLFSLGCTRRLAHLMVANKAFSALFKQFGLRLVAAKVQPMEEKK